MITFEWESIGNNTYRIITRENDEHIMDIVERQDPRDERVARIALFGLLTMVTTYKPEFDNREIDRFLFLD